MKNSPKVSVVLPVYNGARYLRQAIRSIIDQTLVDFELIILDDASTDNSLAIIKGFSDPRIRLVANSKNLGLITTLNNGLKQATGQYVARMDQDDISLPTRFAKQVEFLDAHPQVGLLGTWVQYFDDIGNKTNILRFPTQSEAIKSQLFFGNTLAHPTVMLRREFFINNNLYYSPNYQYAEDYELWTRSTGYFEFACLPEILLLYRRHALGMSLANQEKQREVTNRISWNMLRKIGVAPTPLEKKLHNIVVSQEWGALERLESVRDTEAWLKQLSFRNHQTHLIKNQEFNKVLSRQFFRMCNGTTRYGWEIVRLYLSSELRKFYKPSSIELVKLVVKSLLRS